MCLCLSTSSSSPPPLYASSSLPLYVVTSASLCHRLCLTIFCVQPQSQSRPQSPSSPSMIFDLSFPLRVSFPKPISASCSVCDLLFLMVLHVLLVFEKIWFDFDYQSREEGDGGISPSEKLSVSFWRAKSTGSHRVALHWDSDPFSLFLEIHIDLLHIESRFIKSQTRWTRKAWKTGKTGGVYAGPGFYRSRKF